MKKIFWNKKNSVFFNLLIIIIIVFIIILSFFFPLQYYSVVNYYFVMKILFTSWDINIDFRFLLPNKISYVFTFCLDHRRVLNSWMTTECFAQGLLQSLSCESSPFTKKNHPPNRVIYRMIFHTAERLFIIQEYCRLNTVHGT